MAMKIDERMKHLTKEQIKEVVQLYLDKKNNVEQIIEKYKIQDIRPNEFARILPPIYVGKCEFCGGNMYYKLKNRMSTKDNTNWFCEKCGHIIDKENPVSNKLICPCERCKNQRKQLMDKANDIKNKAFNFAELQLVEQIMLIYLLKNNSVKDINGNISLDELKVKIKDSYVESFLIKLIKKDVILVLANKDGDVINKNDFLESDLVTKAKYKINVLFDSETLDKLKGKRFFQYIKYSDSLDDFIKLFKSLLLEKTKDFFIKEMNIRGFYDLKCNADTNEKIKGLFDNISYTQILGLCVKVIEYYSNMEKEKKIKKFVVEEIAFSNIVKFYQNAIDNDWHIKEKRINSKKHINDVIAFIVEYVLDADYSIFEEVIDSENVKRHIENKDEKYSADDELEFFDNLQELDEVEKIHCMSQELFLKGVSKGEQLFIDLIKELLKRYKPDDMSNVSSVNEIYFKALYRELYNAVTDEKYKKLLYEEYYIE